MMADMDADEADKLMNAYDACMELAAEEEEKKRVEKEVREKLEVMCPAAEKKMAGMSDEQLVAEMDKMSDDELQGMAQLADACEKLDAEKKARKAKKLVFKDKSDMEKKVEEKMREKEMDAMCEELKDVMNMSKKDLEEAAKDMS